MYLYRRISACFYRANWWLEVKKDVWWCTFCIFWILYHIYVLTFTKVILLLSNLVTILDFPLSYPTSNQFINKSHQLYIQTCFRIWHFYQSPEHPYLQVTITFHVDRATAFLTDLFPPLPLFNMLNTAAFRMILYS